MTFLVPLGALQGDGFTPELAPSLHPCPARSMSGGAGQRRGILPSGEQTPRTEERTTPGQDFFYSSGRGAPGQGGPARFVETNARQPALADQRRPPLQGRLAIRQQSQVDQLLFERVRGWRDAGRHAASGCRPGGATKLPGRCRRRRPRRCCAGVWLPRRGWTCWVLTASCTRASCRRRSPGRRKWCWNSGSWNQPLKFSTLPLNCAPARG